MMGTRAELEKFFCWHNARLHECGYPLAVRAELTKAHTPFWKRLLRRRQKKSANSTGDV